MYVKKKLLILFTIVLCLFLKSTAIRADEGLLGGSIPKPPGIGVPLSNYFNKPNGNAIITGDNNSVLQMTNSTSQVSSIWSKDKIDLAKNFTFEAYIYMGKEEKLGEAADGITFSLIDESLGSEYLGDSGSALGIYNVTNPEQKAVPGISLEFDTYYNGDGLDYGFNYVKGAFDHVAIVNTDELSRKQQNDSIKLSDVHYGVTHIGRANATEVTPDTSLSDGNWKKAIVTWVVNPLQWGQPISGTFNYELQAVDGHVIAKGNQGITLGKVRTSSNLNSYQGIGRYAYGGFTAATGNHAANNLIAITRMPSAPQVEQLLTTNLNTIEQNKELEININNKKVSGDENWTNVETTLDLSNLGNFEYISGSAKKNTESIADPVIDNDKKTLTFVKTYSISDSETISLKVKPKIKTEVAKINSWAIGDQTSASANKKIEVTSPNITVEANSQIYNVGKDINSVSLKNFVKNVRFNGNSVDENQYKVELIDKSFSLNQVGNFTAKVRVTSINNSSQTIDIDVPIVILWGHTIVAKDANFSKIVASISMLDNNGVPKLIANKGNGLSTTNYLGSRPFLMFYDQQLNNPKKTISYSTVNQSATSLMNLWNEQLKSINSSLEYGDVISFTVQRYANSSQNYNGSNTWVSKNEQLIKEAEGYTEAYYELTTTGLKLLHLNHLETKNVTLPIYSTEEYLDKNIKDYIDLKGYPNISVKEFSQYPNTKASGQQKGKIIVEETLTTGKKVQYEYEVTFIIGEGELTYSVPKTLTFKEFTKSKSEQTIQRMYSGDLGLKISDNRGQGKQGNWRLTAQVNQSEELSPYLIFRDGTSQDKYLNQGAVEIYSQAKQSNPAEPLNVEVSDQWLKDTGILLKVPSKNHLSSKQYTSKITWNLVEGP